MDPKMRVGSGSGTWIIIGFFNGYIDQYIIIVLYYNNDHWMVFVLKIQKMYHLGSKMDIHNNI
jgi:hypothetical protein